MREMKDSGLQWAGNIPYDWNTTKGKYFMAILERPIKDDDGVITCFRNGEVTLRANRREDGFTIATVEAGYQGIEPGDLVIHGMDGFAGAIGISDSRGKGTPALNVLACSENKKYIMYLLRAMAYTEVFMALSTGIRVRTCDTSWKKLRSLDYLIPPEEEQQSIADFLDAKCAEIDTLTADIQTQIDTLEQYKRSVITETVTKGLNPNAEMKDSGIEWVGKMPLAWDAVPNKYLMYKVKNICPVYNGEDILSLTTNGVIIRDLNGGGKMPTSFDGYQKVTPGNLLMCLFDIDVTPRCIGLVKNFGLTSPAYSQFVMRSGAYAPYYYYYYLMVDYTKELLHMAKNLRHSLTEDQLGAIKAPNPPYEEQVQIAEFLDKKCVEINLVIEDKNRQLATLDEYKKSLIFEYVTGKKEVPTS